MNPRSPRADRPLLAILVLAVLVMGLVSPFDHAWTYALRGWGGEAFGSLMGRSLFEGDAPGAGDVGIVAVLAALVVYLWRPAWSERLRPELGYLSFTALTVSLVAVHGTKTGIGRPRPSLVDAGAAPYSAFYELAAVVPDKLFGTGSFPSGHTASIAVLLAFAYAAGRGRRPLLSGAVVLGAAALMGLSRVATFKHWVTDTLGAVFLCWIVLHVSYHYVLRVPEQRAYLARHGRLPSWPRYWELELFGLVFLAGILAASALVLTRAALASASLGLGLGAALALAPLPVVLKLFAARRARRLAALEVFAS